MVSKADTTDGYSESLIAGLNGSSGNIGIASGLEEGLPGLEQTGAGPPRKLRRSLCTVVRRILGQCVVQISRPYAWN
jgi:hypothetical protein